MRGLGTAVVACGSPFPLYGGRLKAEPAAEPNPWPPVSVFPGQGQLRAGLLSSGCYSQL